MASKNPKKRGKIEDKRVGKGIERAESSSGCGWTREGSIREKG